MFRTRKKYPQALWAAALSAACLPAPLVAEAASLRLDRSRVVSMVPAPREIYDAAGVDFVAWGGRPRPPEKSVADFRRLVSEERARGTEIGGTFGTRTGWRAFLDFSSDAEREAAVCRRCDGTPVLVPGYQSEAYKGFPAYWFSVTSPAFRQMEKGFLDMILDAGVKSLVVDDVLGPLPAEIGFGGCYSTVDTSALRRLSVGRAPGASDTGFDLCTFRRQASVPDSATRRLMVDHFVDSAVDNVRELRAAAAAKGKDIAISGNIALYSAYAGKFMFELDFFTFETSYGKEPQKTDSILNVFALKLGEQLAKPTILLGHGTSHRYIAEHNAMTLLRSWIAQSYAYGGYFVVPNGLWMDRKINGSDWLSVAPGEYVPLYRFIKDNKALFDGHDEVAKVAILHDTRILDTESVYDNAVQKTQTYNYALDLLKRGIPFSIIPVNSDEDLDRAVTGSKRRYDYFLAPVQLREALAKRSSNGKVVFDTAGVPAEYVIELKGSDRRLYTSLRRASEGDGRYVLHVLNVDYDASGDAIRPSGPVEVRIPKAYLGKAVAGVRVFAFDAKGHAPSGVPSIVAARDDGADVVLKLDSVGLWSLIEF